MELKNYQKNTLEAVKDFFEKVQGMDVSSAFAAVVSSGDRPDRLKGVRAYQPNPDSPGVPQVTVKVPTGGGKTIIAAHGIKIIAEAQGVQYPFVLWFTPSETIRRQTAEALKNPTHPYRRELDAAFGGNVKVFDIDEKFMIRPGDIADHVCIVVTTAQAFRHKDHDKYKVYKSHEDLEDHFADLPLMDGMEAMDDDPKKPKTSFANLVIKHAPVMIVDEAHKMMSDLSKETVAGLKPSAILELTATPVKDCNVLYSVRASELYDEEMIKLPVELTEYTADWRNCMLEALRKRDELQTVADAETASDPAKYLRPIVLFQASSKAGETPIAEVKKFLIETAHKDEREIAVVTGEQKELDGIDVTSPDCPIKYVITVEALKEGWDCPSAYVLCSVANVHSNTDTVQLLGRVMRQPQAKRRTSPALNRSYAYVLSSSFNSAAQDLVDGLKGKGFDDDEALAAIMNVPRLPANLPQFDDPAAVKLPAGAAGDAVVALLPRSVEVRDHDDGTKTLEVPANIAPAVQKSVVQTLVDAGMNDAAVEFVAKANNLKTAADASAPAKTESLVLPKLVATVQGELVFDVDGAYDATGVDIEGFLPSTLSDDDFRLSEEGGKTTELFLNNGKIAYRASAQAHQMFLAGFSGTLDEADAVNALDAIVLCPYIRPEKKRGWIAGVVNHLVNVKRYSADKLYCYRFQLKRCLAQKLDMAYKAARKNAYQQVFSLDDGHAPSLEFANGFKFDDGLYKNSVLRFYPGGDYVFTKHFLGPNRIPAFDGKKVNGEGEEYECAKALDQNVKVKFWLRNADSNSESFRLPVSGGWFYPDFIGLLNDGRMFVVEYKGKQLLTNADTAEKTAVGALWASLDANCLYATVSDGKDGKTTSQQIDALFM